MWDHLCSHDISLLMQRRWTLCHASHSDCYSFMLCTGTCMHCIWQPDWSVGWSIYQHACLCVGLLTKHVQVPACLSCLSLCKPRHNPSSNACLSICLSVRLSVMPVSVYPSYKACSSACLPACLPACLLICQQFDPFTDKPGCC